MSNALAIATVTAALREVLQNALAPPAPPGPAGPLSTALTVSHLSPDDASLTGPSPDATVNIFLYQVTPNTAWRNADLPTRRADGVPLRRPQAALDLHYLLTFHGKSSTLEPQRLLGAVVRQLHAHPSLTGAQIDAVLGLPFLNNAPRSNLADQLDLVRFTPTNFSLEEMSKLWSVFLKTDYVLSLAYVAGVVLIETDDPPPATAPPVRERVVVAVPLAQAVLDAADPPMPESAPGLTLTLRGRHLGDPANVVRIDDAPADIPPTAAPTDDAVTIALPATLRPGVHQARVIQPGPLGPGHVGPQSNPAFFVLRPKVNTVTFAGGKFTADATPQVGKDQKVFLILNQIEGGTNHATLTLPATPRTADTEPLLFDPASVAAAIPSGAHFLARVRVDDAESLLTGGGFGPPPDRLPVPYAGPRVDVP